MKHPIWSIDGVLTGTTTKSLSGPESNGIEGILHISQSSRTGTSPPNALLVGGSYPSAVMQLAYSSAPAESYTDFDLYYHMNFNNNVLLAKHILLKVVLWLSSLALSRADSADFPDSLSPSVPIIHLSRQVFQSISCASTELMLISSC